jgi:hypothetical protein
MLKFNSIGSISKQITGVLTVCTLIGMQTGLTSASAATPAKTPLYLAQETNGRIATLKCGAYTITIRFVGNASSNVYSYETRGLYLGNGSREGDDYIFYNNDYEYRVTTKGGGSGRLQVLHYGERMLDKQCTWS